MVTIASFTRLSANTTASRTEVSSLDLTKGLKDRYEQYSAELQDADESADSKSTSPEPEGMGPNDPSDSNP